MSTALGKTYARYAVRYHAAKEGRKRSRQMTVSLIEDYTVFEDIRQIISIREGVESSAITVLSSQLIGAVMVDPVTDEMVASARAELTRSNMDATNAAVFVLGYIGDSAKSGQMQPRHRAMVRAWEQWLAE